MPYFENNFGRIFTGAASTSPFHVGMMNWILNWSTGKKDHQYMKIH
jgi:hypothetical protein